MKLLWCALTIVGFCAHLSALASLASHHNSLSSEFSHDAPNISQSSEEFKRTGLQRGAIPLREELMDPSRGLRTDCSHLNQGVLNIRPAGQKRPARVFNLAGLMDEYWNFFFFCTSLQRTNMSFALRSRKYFPSVVSMSQDWEKSIQFSSFTLSMEHARSWTETIWSSQRVNSTWLL